MSDRCKQLTAQVKRVNAGKMTPEEFAAGLSPHERRLILDAFDQVEAEERSAPDAPPEVEQAFDELDEPSLDPAITEQSRFDADHRSGA